MGFTLDLQLNVQIQAGRYAGLAFDWIDGVYQQLAGIERVACPCYRHGSPAARNRLGRWESPGPYSGPFRSSAGRRNRWAKARSGTRPRPGCGG